MSFDSNFLVGTIPDEVMQLPDLTVFVVRNNKLNGPIPPFFASTLSKFHFIFGVFGVFACTM